MNYTELNNAIMESPPTVLGGKDEEEDEDESVHVLLGYVPGTYGPPSKSTSKEAFLGLYFNSYHKTSPYSYCYHGKEGDYMGHHSPFPKDTSIQMAMLEAWHEYRIEPYYWIIPEDPIEDDIGDSRFVKQCRERRGQLNNCADFFKKKEETRQWVYGDDDEKYESDRLFYPSVPPKPEREGPSLTEEMDKMVKEWDQELEDIMGDKSD